MYLDFKKIIALSFVIPTYFIFFIGKEPIIQGLAYLSYLIPFYLLINKKEIKLSKPFLFNIIIFLLLLLIPSIINFQRNTLESELIRLDVLFYHAFMLTIIFIIFYNYSLKDVEIKLREYFSLMLFFSLPMVLLIFFKTIYLFLISDWRPHPFYMHPNVASEIMLAILIISLQLKNSILKWMIVFISLLTSYLCESRGAIISMYIILFFLFIPSLFFSINKYKVYFLILFSFLIIFFHDLFFSLFQNFLLLNHNYENIAGRLDIWIISLNLFYENIYSGIGFFVSPLGYSVPANFPDWATIDNPSFQIHNAFLRIATENGIGLFLFVTIIILLALFKTLINRNFYEFGILVGIIFFLFFSTRHLTLNLLNILFYFYIIKALTYKNAN